jgi:SAM-dependent methyltransferase
MSLKEKHRFEDCWRWPASFERFVRDRVDGKALNVCAGESDIGDVKVDAEPRQDGVIQADMRKLPFPDASFDTVVSDPPWKIGYYQRFRPFFECVRVCKPGGRIIYNATWLPESDQTELDELRVRQDEEFSDASVLSVHTRFPGQESLADYNTEEQHD